VTQKDAARLWPEARRLYAASYSMTRIGTELGASRNTLASWRAKDGGTDNDWDALRTKQIKCDPYSPVRSQRKRVEQLLALAPERLDDAKYDHQVREAMNSLDWVEARYGSADRIQEVLEQFALWARANTKPDQLRCSQCGHALDPLAILHDMSDGFMKSVERGELELAE
jgi:hypothetical protein